MIATDDFRWRLGKWTPTNGATWCPQGALRHASTCKRKSAHCVCSNATRSEAKMMEASNKQSAIQHQVCWLLFLSRFFDCTQNPMCSEKKTFSKKFRHILCFLEKNQQRKNYSNKQPSFSILNKQMANWESKSKLRSVDEIRSRWQRETNTTQFPSSWNILVLQHCPAAKKQGSLHQQWLLLWLHSSCSGLFASRKMANIENKYPKTKEGVSRTCKVDESKVNLQWFFPSKFTAFKITRI